RSGEHVEVVHRVAGCGHARAVESPGDHVDVAVTDDELVVEAELGRVGDVGAVEPEPVGVDVGGAGAPDPEVVQLLVVDRALGRVVVLVRRVARPVPVGGEQLDAHQAVGVRPRLGAGEVGDLASGGAGAADLDGDV